MTPEDLNANRSITKCCIDTEKKKHRNFGAFLQKVNSQKLFNIRFLETEVLFLIDSLQDDTQDEGGNA